MVGLIILACNAGKEEHMIVPIILKDVMVKLKHLISFSNDNISYNSLNQERNLNNHKS